MNLLPVKHKPPWEHWCNTSVEEATDDALPLLLKLPGLLSVLGLNSVIAAVAFFAEYPNIAYLLVLVALLFWIWWWRDRKAVKREIGLLSNLHLLVENFRSESWRLRDAPTNDPQSGEVYALNYLKFNQTIADDVANFYRKFMNDSSVCCAIRLLHPKERSSGQVVSDGALIFRTIVRSSGLSKDRERDSIDLEPNEGIALALRDSRNAGVYVIRDFTASEVQGKWKVSQNDLRSDIRRVMVAPINQCDSERKEMLGMLFVTTAEGDFEKRHVEPLKAFADLLGLVYPLVTHEVWFAARHGGAAMSGGKPSESSSSNLTGENNG